MMLLSQVCDAVNGKCVGGDTIVKNVSINTRADCEGRLFVALKGDQFDAHDYIDQAALAGAVAVMVEHDVTTDLPQIRVGSTHQALKDLAAWWRLQFAIPVLAITGSVGKTTVKEMLGSITAELGRGVVTMGNLNNEIGVPLTLMRLTAEDRYAVIEMGMNHAGEIERLSGIGRPTVATVNNAAAAHLENLGSIEAVAHAKGEIFSGLTADGVAVINADDAFAVLWRELAVGKKILSFGLHAQADVTATYKQDGRFLVISVNANGQQAQVRLDSLGEHNVSNALAAIATALAANMPLNLIVRGLQNYQPVSGRLQPIQMSHFVLFDDTYNANPASMQAAINVLSGYDSNLLIVGDMAELGVACEAEHEALGEFAAAHGINRLMACGQYAELVVRGFVRGRESHDKQHASQHPKHGEREYIADAFEGQATLLSALLIKPITAAAVLVKGSRSARMEVVVNALKEADGQTPTKSTNIEKNSGDQATGRVH